MSKCSHRNYIEGARFCPDCGLDIKQQARNDALVGCGAMLILLSLWIVFLFWAVDRWVL